MALLKPLKITFVDVPIRNIDIKFMGYRIVISGINSNE